MFAVFSHQLCVNLLSSNIKLMHQSNHSWVYLWLFISQGVSYKQQKSTLVTLLPVMLILRSSLKGLGEARLGVSAGRHNSPSHTVGMSPWRYHSFSHWEALTAVHTINITPAGRGSLLLRPPLCLETTCNHRVLPAI